MAHPLAHKYPRNGARDMMAGDRVRCKITGKTGVADEFLPDGEALVSWDDGTFGEPKWINLVSIN